MNWAKLQEDAMLYRGKKKKTKKKRKKELRAKVEKFATEHQHNPTPAENSFAKLLRYLNMDFEMQKVFSCKESMYIVDFYLPQYKTVVEIDGGYHNTPQQRKKDRKRTQALKKQPLIIRIIRFQNEEIQNTPDITWRLLTGICPQVARLFDKHNMQISADVPGAFVVPQYKGFEHDRKTGVRTNSHTESVH